MYFQHKEHEGNKMKRHTTYCIYTLHSLVACIINYQKSMPAIMISLFAPFRIIASSFLICNVLFTSDLVCSAFFLLLLFVHCQDYGREVNTKWTNAQTQESKSSQVSYVVEVKDWHLVSSSSFCSHCFMHGQS